MTAGGRIMIGYGAFLVAGAMVAIFISGWDRSKTALISSGGAALLMCGMAMLSVAPSATARRIGSHLGLVLTLIFAATFGWRLSLNWAKPSAEEWLAANPGMELVTAAIESPLQNWLFPTFIVGSLVAFALILRQRPDPVPR